MKYYLIGWHNIICCGESWAVVDAVDITYILPLVVLYLPSLHIIRQILCHTEPI
jgi:hypothetical protein